jgi:hypothetical protein
MCIFGGGSSAPVTDPQAEAAQAAQLKKEQEEKAAQNLESSVALSKPLVSTGASSPAPTMTVNVPGGQVDIPTESTVIQKRKADTVLQRRRMRRGRRSLITGSGGGIGYYRGNV